MHIKPLYNAHDWTLCVDSADKIYWNAPKLHNTFLKPKEQVQNVHDWTLYMEKKQKNMSIISFLPEKGWVWVGNEIISLFNQK